MAFLKTESLQLWKVGSYVSSCQSDEQVVN